MIESVVLHWVTHHKNSFFYYYFIYTLILTMQPGIALSGRVFRDPNDVLV